MSNYQREMDMLREVLGITGVAVTGWQYQGDSIIRIQVKSTQACGVCPICGQLCSQAHDVGDEQLIRDLPMSKGGPAPRTGRMASRGHRRCWLMYQPRRFECQKCERTFVERVSWKSPDLNYTLRYEEHIYARCRRETLADGPAPRTGRAASKGHFVARDERLSEDVAPRRATFVRNIFERWAKKKWPPVAIPS